MGEAIKVIGVKIPIEWNNPREPAFVECPLDGKINVRDCWHYNVEREKHDCEYFSNMEVGYIVCLREG